MRSELSDGRIRIRRYRADDADALYEAVRESIDKLIKWMPWCHPDYSRDESVEWTSTRDADWESGVTYDFVIEDNETRRFLGGCGINNIDNLNKHANLGYWAKSGCTGKGVATAAAMLMIKFAFEDLGLVRIEIVHAIENKASRRVIEKTGAFKEGVARNRVMLSSGPHDAIVYSLIPADIK